MAHQPGPKELQLKELKAARLARKSNPFKDAARGRDPDELRAKVAAIKGKAPKPKKKQRANR